MPTPRAPGTPLARVIGLTQATAIVVGTVIGTSIFVQPSEITRVVPTTTGILVAWSLAGALTVLGAIVCAELASAFPQTGGVYVFLREAFSVRVAFLWGWASFWSIHTGVIAAIAVVCARYLTVMVPVGPAAERAGAVAIIVAVSAVNYVGVRTGTRVQTAITGAKLLALAALLVAGFTADGHPDAAGGALTLANLAAVPLDRMLLGVSAGLFAFGGWHLVTYTAGETTDPARTLPRALTLGTIIVTVCYLLLNAAYLHVLPLDAVRASPRIAADVAQAVAGPAAASAVSALVVLSATGALMGIVLAGPRLYLSMAGDSTTLGWLHVVHPVYRTPHRAILLQAAWASILVVTGSYATIFSRVIYMEWGFFALMTAGVFVLRRRPAYQPAFRMWAYPVTPILFILASTAVVVNQLRAQPAEALVGAAIVAGGWPVARWATRVRA